MERRTGSAVRSLKKGNTRLRKLGLAQVAQRRKRAEVEARKEELAVRTGALMARTNALIKNAYQRNYERALKLSKGKLRLPDIINTISADTRAFRIAGMDSSRVKEYVKRMYGKEFARNPKIYLRNCILMNFASEAADNAVFESGLYDELIELRDIYADLVRENPKHEAVKRLKVVNETAGMLFGMRLPNISKAGALAACAGVVSQVMAGAAAIAPEFAGDKELAAQANNTASATVMKDMMLQSVPNLEKFVDLKSVASERKVFELISPSEAAKSGNFTSAEMDAICDMYAQEIVNNASYAMEYGGWEDIKKHIDGMRAEWSEIELYKRWNIWYCSRHVLMNQTTADTINMTLLEKKYPDVIKDIRESSNKTVRLLSKYFKLGPKFLFGCAAEIRDINGRTAALFSEFQFPEKERRPAELVEDGLKFHYMPMAKIALKWPYRTSEMTYEDVLHEGTHAAIATEPLEVLDHYTFKVHGVDSLEYKITSYIERQINESFKHSYTALIETEVSHFGSGTGKNYFYDIENHFTPYRIDPLTGHELPIGSNVIAPHAAREFILGEEMVKRLVGLTRLIKEKVPKEQQYETAVRCLRKEPFFNVTRTLDRIEKLPQPFGELNKQFNQYLSQDAWYEYFRWHILGLEEGKVKFEESAKLGLKLAGYTWGGYGTVITPISTPTPKPTIPIATPTVKPVPTVHVSVGPTGKVDVTLMPSKKPTIEPSKRPTITVGPQKPSRASDVLKYVISGGLLLGLVELIHRFKTREKKPKKKVRRKKPKMEYSLLDNYH